MKKARAKRAREFFLDLFDFVYVSESDIVGPIEYLSDIDNSVSYKRAIFEDYSFTYRT